MGLDIRLPIGLMFCLVAQLLLLAGWLDHTPLNTMTGGAMLIFGLVMLFFCYRGRGVGAGDGGGNGSKGAPR